MRNAKRRDRISRSNSPTMCSPSRRSIPDRRGRSIRWRPARSRAKGRRSRVVADFLQAAAEQYGFVPQRPASDLDFKRAYARAARAAGLTREQIVGVYAFETGGNGTYDTQAGRRAAAAPARDLAGHRLQPVAQHQFGLDPGRARRPRAGGAAAEGQGARRRREGRDGAQDRGAQAHDRVQPQRAGQLERARPAGQDHHGRDGHSRRHPRHRYRPAAAGAEAAQLGALRARQGLQRAAHRGRTGIDESDRRRQRLRHGDHAAAPCASACRPRISSSSRATSAIRWRAAPAWWRA